MDAVKIEINEIGQGSIKVGEMDLSNCVRSIKFESKAGKLTVIEIHIRGKLSVEAVANVTIVEHTGCRPGEEEEEIG